VIALSPRDKAALVEMLAGLRRDGVTDRRILSAIAAVPRRVFVSAPYQPSAYTDKALPIECGQVMSAPSVTAVLLAALDLKLDHKVLEVGTGSGYQTAILAHMVTRVVTMDRFRTLGELAEDRLAALKIENVNVIVADGLEGFTRHAPYDRILVDGAVSRIPPPLLDQLGDKGVLVAPVGTGSSQTLVRVVRDGRLFHRQEVGTVRFVPLVEGVAARL